MGDSEPVLAGVTVLDVGAFVTAPKPARYLAEFGAEVIRIERPGEDALEMGGEALPDWLPYQFEIFNRGKKRIGLDLTSEEGVEVFYDLARDADVVIENRAPGRMEEFGIGYEDIRAINSDIIYCSISGYGATGPWADKKSMDYMAQGMSGIAYQNALRAGNDEPALSGWYVADELTSVYAFSAILIALMRDRGTHIDLSLLDCLLGSFSQKGAFYSAGEEIRPPGAREGAYFGPRGMYPTASGPITFYLANPTPHKWRDLWEAIELDEWVEEDRYLTREEMQGNGEHIESTVTAQLESKPREYWLERMWERDLTVAPVLETEEAFEHEQLDDRTVLSAGESDQLGEYLQMNFPAMYSDFEREFDDATPPLGEHTREILRRHGYTDEDIEDLYASEVVV